MPIVDTLIHARWVIPVVPHDTVLEDHVVAVHKTKIVAIFPAEELRHRAFTATNTYTLKEHVLMPGLVNAHTHLPMSLLRGYADDMKLMTWLNDHIWPAEKRWLNEEFSFDGAMLSGVEMLLSGTTCFNDHYPFGHVIADAAKQLRMRCRIGLFMIDHPTSYANNFDEYVSHAMQWHQDVANDPLISLALAPHSPYAMQDSSLKRLQQLQHELQLPVHMHLHETQDEIDHSMKTYGMRPLKRLAQHNLLSKKFTGVHLSCCHEEDIDMLQKHQVRVVSCPQSNAKLASGVAPVPQMLAAGIPVGLGTDSVASNNSHCMFTEMKFAALAFKQASQDPTVVSAHQAIRMATLHSAEAMGLGDVIGSLETGKAADMIAVNLMHPATQPVYHPASQLVYSVGREQVSDVWVNGTPLLKNHAFTKLPLKKVMQKTKNWGLKINNRMEQNKQANN